MSRKDVPFGIPEDSPIWDEFFKKGAGTNASGLVPPSEGGTGISSYAQGDMLYASASDTLAKLNIGTAGKILRSNGSTPAWSTFSIPDTISAGGLYYGSSSNVVSVLSIGTDGQVLSTNGTSVLWDVVDLIEIAEASGSTATTLLHFDGVDGSTTITDDGTSPATWVSSGAGCEIDTTQSKFGGASLLFDNSGELFENTTNFSNLNHAGGWTIDFWWRAVTLTEKDIGLLFVDDTGSFGTLTLDFYGIGAGSAGQLYLSLDSNGSGPGYDIVDNTVGLKNNFTPDTWYHIAIARDVSAGKYYVYVDGVKDIEVTSATSIGTTQYALPLYYSIGVGDDTRWLEEFRISSECLYPGGATFTPPTTAASTSLYPLLASSVTGNVSPVADSGLSYNPTDGALTATEFIGALTGNADTATILQTARTIGGVSFNGSANIVPTTIVVADTTDSTCFVGLFESATGNLLPKTDAGLLYDATTGTLTATIFSGSSSTVSVADTTDSTCFLALFESATGNLAAKTDAGILYNASAGLLSLPTNGSAAGIAIGSTPIQWYYDSGTGWSRIVANGGAAYGVTSASFGWTNSGDPSTANLVLFSSFGPTVYISGATPTISFQDVTHSAYTQLAGNSSTQDIEFSDGIYVATTIQLGHATDTTISRVSAGVIAVEGSNVLLASGIGSVTQAYDAGLADIAGLAVTDSNIIVGNGTNWVAESGATARASLGLTIGTHVQAYSANLDEYAAVNPTTAGLALLDDATAADQLVTLGLTATAAEINILDGATLTVTELNYVDGVTSAIQTQIDGKQPLDADLTAIAALTTTAYGRGLLELADETALEALLDTLPNLTSVQGLTVTLADAGADAILGWDDSAGAYENLTASEVLDIIKTVDGAGSGLDADLLDGNSSAFFATATGLSDHLADPTDAHDASAISFSATGNIVATDVQAAIAELDTEKQPLDADLTAIAALTTTAYGRGLLELADETALEATLDTLPNLVSVQGLTVTLADAGADALLGWDDSASAYENLTKAEAQAVLGLLSTTVDNTLPRFDSTAGNMQSSGVTISDGDIVTALGFVADDQLLVSTGTSVTYNGTVIPAFQVNGDSANAASLGFSRWSVGAGAPFFIGAKSRGGGTVGVHGAVIDGEDLFVIIAEGSDGSGFFRAARVLFEAEGTISAGVVPGRVTIQTANSSGTMTDAFRIDSSQFLYHYANFVSETAYSRVAFKHVSQTLASVSGATVTATSIIPARANLVGVNTKVTVSLGTGGGTTGYQVGDGVDADRWGNITGTSTNTDTDGNNATADPGGGWSTAARNVVITANGGNFNGTGSIRVDVFYTITEAD